MTNSQPLVSIITPCYNYGRFLTETLECLLQQTYTNWECIIVNDGSTDITEEIATKFSQQDSRFKYIYQNNTGLPGARNTALSKANGKYIQLLDADDLLEHDKLSLQINLLESKSNIDLVYSNTLLFKSDAKIREYSSFQLPNSIKPCGRNEILITALIDDTFFLPGCVLFRREMYEKVGKFNESLYGLEDWNYWSRAALLGFEFYFDDRPGTRLLCRDHDSNMSKVYVKMLKARIQARSHIIEVTNELKRQKQLLVNDSFIDEILKKHQVQLLLDEYQYHLHYGKKIKGIKAFLSYSIKAGKPFFIFEKLFSGLKKA